MTTPVVAHTTQLKIHLLTLEPSKLHTKQSTVTSTSRHHRLNACRKTTQQTLVQLLSFFNTIPSQLSPHTAAREAWSSSCSYLSPLSCWFSSAIWQDQLAFFPVAMCPHPVSAGGKSRSKTLSYNTCLFFYPESSLDVFSNSPQKLLVVNVWKCLNELLVVSALFLPQ